MGYSTEFKGSFQTDREMDEQFVSYINRFAHIRHMKRNEDRLKKCYPDWKENCFMGQLGKDGQYFTGDDGWKPSNYTSFSPQGKDDSVTDYNAVPDGIPSLWCQWVAGEDRKSIEWDGGEKFHHYVEWLVYLIDNFFRPAGYVLNGDVEWQGEELLDRGCIHVVNNEAQVEYL